VNIARGLLAAFGFFAASFALHIVGGATGQGWLFAIAVALIYLTASAFPVIALWSAGHVARATHVVGPGALIGIVLTASALRAANDRTFAWWQPPLAVVLVLVTGLLLAVAARWYRDQRRPRPASAPMT
jgi:uncharacterized membrane protein